MMDLSPRLKALAAMIPDGASVADIGCDHGQLSAALAQQGHAVIACDVSAPSLDKARRLTAALQLQDRIRLRLGDGLSVLEAGEVQAAVLAGMSGQNMLDILDASPETAASVQRYICQPMQGADTLRQGMRARGYAIVAEDLVQEAHRFFQIIVFEKGVQRPLTALEAEFGPGLLAGGHPLLKRWMEAQLQRCVRQTEASASAAHRAKVRRRMAQLEEIMHECR